MTCSKPSNCKLKWLGGFAFGLALSVGLAYLAFLPTNTLSRATGWVSNSEETARVRARM